MVEEGADRRRTRLHAVDVAIVSVSGQRGRCWPLPLRVCAVGCTLLLVGAPCPSSSPSLSSSLIQPVGAFQPLLPSVFGNNPQYPSSLATSLQKGRRLSYPIRRGATDTSQETGVEVVKASAASAPRDDLAATESTEALGTAGDKASSAVLLSEDVESDPNYLPILALCFVVACLSALDRVAMSVAILPLSTELHLTETVKGQISSIFSVGYGMAILPCGLLVAALSPRLIMACGVIIWSIATFGTPLAAGLVTVKEIIPDGVDGGMVSTIVTENVAPLLIIRAVMGAAESVVLPAIQRILANWVPPSKKSLAVAGIFSGFQFGTISAYLLSPIVIEQYGGWKGMFYLYGVVGLLWIVPWLAFARDVPPGLASAAVAENHEEEETVLVNTMRDDDMSLVPEHLQSMKVAAGRGGSAALSAAEIVVEPELPSQTAFEEAVAVLKEAPWKDLLTSRAAWGMTIAHAANNWGLYNNLSWTPTFYAEQYGLSVKDSAFLSLLPSVAGAIGGLFAGSVADAIIERVGGGDEQKTLVRKVFQGVALLGPAACLLTLSNDIPAQPAAAQALLTGTVGLQAFNAAGYGAATQEKAAKWAGLLYSVTSLPGVIFGSLGVYATGQILDITGQDWSVVFGINALVDIVGAAAFIGLYNAKREFD